MAVPGLLERLHSVPRRLLDGTAVSNTFNLSDRDYLVAIITQAAGFEVLAVAVLILFPLLFCIGCCCTRGGADASKAGRCCGRLGCSGVTYMLTSLAFAAAAAAAVAYTDKFDQGGRELLDAFTALSGLLANTTGLVEPIAASASAVSSTSIDLYAQAASLGASVPTLDAIQALQYAAGNLSVGASSLASALNSTASALRASVVTEGTFQPADISGSSSTDSVNAAAARAGITAVSLSILGIALGWSLLTACLLSPNRVSACLFRASSACTIPAAALILAVTGGMYGVALLGADICVDTRGAVVSLVNTTGAGAVAAASVVYYADCGAQPGLAPTGVVAVGRDLSLALLNTQAQVEAFNSSVAADPTLSPLLPSLVDLAGNVSAALLSATALDAQIACTPVNSVWTAFVSATCDTAVLSVARAFVGLAAASLLSLILLSAGAVVNCHHPGAASAPSKDELYAVAKEDLRAARVAAIAAATPGGGYGGPAVGRPVSVAPVATGSYQGGAGGKQWR